MFFIEYIKREVALWQVEEASRRVALTVGEGGSVYNKALADQSTALQKAWSLKKPPTRETVESRRVSGMQMGQKQRVRRSR